MRVLDQRYELLEHLGSGAMASVWRAHDRRLILIPGPDAVQRVFRLTLVDRRLEFEGDGSTDTEGPDR